MSTIVRSDRHDGQSVPTTGVHGHTLGAAKVMHAAAFQHKSIDISDLPVDEEYDLVVAGAGLSGLATAFFYRQRFGNDKKILIVDPLADFGGHASRNVFEVDGKTIFGYGGSESLQSPKLNFSKVVHELLAALQIDLSRFENTYFQASLYPDLGLSRGTFFGHEHFGTDTLVTGDPTPWMSDDVAPGRLHGKPLAEFIGSFPMSEAARKQILDIYTSKRVTLGHLATPEARAHYLASTSYDALMRQDWQLSDEAVRYFSQRTVDFLGSRRRTSQRRKRGTTVYPACRASTYQVNHITVKSDLSMSPTSFIFPMATLRSRERWFARSYPRLQQAQALRTCSQPTSISASSTA